MCKARGPRLSHGQHESAMQVRGFPAEPASLHTKQLLQLRLDLQIRSTLQGSCFGVHSPEPSGTSKVHTMP